MSDFKGRHFRGEIVLWAVRWYCRYPIGYRDLEAMMTERGVAVDHSTIYRWVQRFAPEMEKRLRWQWRRPQSRSWRVDETYIKVRGKWAYLYRAVDKLGNTIDFYLSATRNTKAAKRFLGKALRGLKEWEQPEVLNTDKAPAYAAAIAELKAEGKCPKDTRHRLSTAAGICTGAAAQICTTGSVVACPRSPWEGPARGATRPPRGWRRPARGRMEWTPPTPDAGGREG